MKGRPVHQPDCQVKCRLPLFLKHMRTARERNAPQEPEVSLLFFNKGTKKSKSGAGLRLTCPLARGMGSMRSTPSANTWTREKMSRALTASHSVCSRDVASGHFFLAKRFSVYFATMKSFLACLRADTGGR